MKLYPKQLHGLEELRREKYALKYAAKQSDKKKLFSVDSEDAGGVANASIIGTALSLLTSKSLLSTVVTSAPSLINLIGSKRAKSSFVQRIAKEVIGGYVKWKAIQMAYRGVKLMSKSRDRKHKN